MSTEKTVLGVFRERRRPITFNSGNTPKEEYGNLLEAVKSGFDNILIANEGPSSSSHGIEALASETTQYYIQRESKEWGGLVDVTGFV